MSRGDKELVKAATVKANHLRLGAIMEAIPGLMEEGGLPEVMKFLDMLIKTGFLPASDVKALKKQARVMAVAGQPQF